MKKLFTIAAFSLFVFSTYAQDEFSQGYKPVKGTITTEVGLTGGLNNANFNLNTGALKFRYFMKNDVAFRLGFATNSNRTEAKDNSNPNDIETTINKNSNTTVNLGIEKHFAGSDRLSTYAGADLLIGFSGATTEFTQNGFSYTVDGANQDLGTGLFSNNAGNFFGLRLLTGADYYIAKKLFIGVEAGLNITISGKNKDIEIAQTGQPNVTIAGGKFSGISTNVIGGVRLGYQF